MVDSTVRGTVDRQLLLESFLLYITTSYVYDDYGNMIEMTDLLIPTIPAT